MNAIALEGLIFYHGNEATLCVERVNMRLESDKFKKLNPSWSPSLNFIVKSDDLISGLPGEELVRQGLADFQAGLCTIPSCLVRIARPRLSRAGLMPQSVPGQSCEPELELYGLLKLERGDGYSRYNALLRELVSFENALDRRNRKAKTLKVAALAPSLQS